MKVLILPKYGPKGASSRYRFYNYERYFSERDIHLDFKPLLSNGYIEDLYNKKVIKIFLRQILSIIKRIILLILLKKNKYDAYIIEKELLPNIPYFIEFALLKGKIYLMDFDDYVGATYKTNKFKKFFGRNKIEKLVEKSVLTTVGNHWYFSEFKSNNLYYLPTVVDLTNYSLIKQDIFNNEIVWIGSPHTAKYLKIIEPILVKLIQEIPFVLKVIGGNINLHESIPVRKIEWHPLQENRELASSDIGIMPLENSIWEKGKCGFKLIQYMASGLPVIGSNLPANEEIIIDGETGFIAKNEDDWYTKLKYLLIHKKEAHEMGIRGRKRVEEYYSYQKWGDKYASLIRETVKQFG